MISSNEIRNRPIDIPARSLSNVRFNKSRKIIEMGGQTNCRQLFNLSQAKSYMQTLLVATGCKSLIDQQKSTSIRGLYYLLKHTIEGTREETFADQDECDPIIEDLEVTLQSLREELREIIVRRLEMRARSLDLLQQPCSLGLGQTSPLVGGMCQRLDRLEGIVSQRSRLGNLLTEKISGLPGVSNMPMPHLPTHAVAYPLSFNSFATV